MKKVIIICVATMLAYQSLRAQGITYLSNLGQTPTGSLAVGNDLWLAAEFRTGSNVSGYVFNSILLEMGDASGNPSGFTVMIYSSGGAGGNSPGSSLGTLNGSNNPSPAGTYTYIDDLSIILSPSTIYYIVLTSGTSVANGYYNWSYVNSSSYNSSDGWGWFQPFNPFHSSNGSSWTGYTGIDPLFALTATPIPEPSILGLVGLSSLFFILRRK